MHTLQDGRYVKLVQPGRGFLQWTEPHDGLISFLYWIDQAIRQCQLDIDIGIAIEELCDHRHQRMTPKRNGRVNAQTTMRLGVGRLRQPVGGFHFGKHRLALLQIEAAEHRQALLAGGPIQ